MKAVRLGQPLNRVDGRAKVTGTAKYSAEFTSERLTHGFVIASGIARGEIEEIDAREALAVPGVIHVLTHENRPKLPWLDRSYRDQDAPAGSPFRPLYDEEIHFSGQPIGLVVAESFEIARYAASLVRVRHRAKEHRTDLRAARKDAYHPKPRPLVESMPKPRGHADEALAQAKYRIDVEYRTPTEYHNPLEPHACTVLWQPDGTLVVYDKTQGVFNSQSYVCKVFDLAKDKVRVVSPFVGGAFGVALRPQHSLFLAVMAALECKRDVRVVLTRQQTFALGHRPETLQALSLGADENGKLVAVKHSAIAETSRAEDYTEAVVTWSGNMYQCSDVAFDHKVVDLDVATPMDMRAPGAALGIFALESAMDELAHAAGVDPLEIRLRNYAERDQNHDKPFSSKELRACYAQGADRFGWEKRSAAPRSMRDGRSLIGWGMATGAWEATQMPARCKARLGVDGKLVVESGTSDIGTGTYTVMSQIAAATLGLPIADVTFVLGDTALPMAPLQGGSWTVASVGSAVEEVCRKIGEQLLAMAKKVERSPLAKASLADVVFEDGHVCLAQKPDEKISIREAMRHAGALFVEDVVTTVPNVVAQKGYTRATHSAVFVEVAVDEDLGTIRVRRVVSAIAGGKIINEKTARSQILGAVVWGLGMALEEEALVDHALGRVMNHSLAEYHVLVHADVPEIDVIFVEEKDTIVNPLGAKGLGEIGIVGVAAAVANAVFHATGKRVRELPITLDKVW